MKERLEQVYIQPRRCFYNLLIFGNRPFQRELQRQLRCFIAKHDNIQRGFNLIMENMGLPLKAYKRRNKQKDDRSGPPNNDTKSPKYKSEEAHRYAASHILS